MSKTVAISGILLIIGALSLAFKPDWGFYAHKRINRLAVFTLPSDLIPFYKKNIDFITEHAVDPDKRRYATKHEAVRHYIDLDQWGKAPFEDVPRDWLGVLVKYTDIYSINTNGDTLQLFGNGFSIVEKEEIHSPSVKNRPILNKTYRNFFKYNILPLYYEDDWILDCDSVYALFNKQIDCVAIFAKDRFSEHGILPYHLLQMQNRLKRAFIKGNVNQILRLSADMGHYIGDAHVPLHTTKNYNGQLTDQIGIHAFWESRLPELYADERYDFFVGQATYIDNPKDYYWNIVLESHAYVDSVLAIEKALSLQFPPDQQYTFEERGATTQRVPSRPYSEAFHKRLKGQVEARMTGAIRAIGSAWYTAWVDAGQPNLRHLGLPVATEEAKKAEKELEQKFENGQIKGRTHEN